MKKNDTANRPFSSLSTRSFHAGGYSVAAAVIVLAIAVAVNALVGNLPSTYTKLDTTANGLYTVSEQTERSYPGWMRTLTFIGSSGAGTRTRTLRRSLTATAA